jgi:hypothetical protein
MSRPTIATLLQFYATLNEILYYPHSNYDPSFLRAGMILGALLFGVPVLLWCVREILQWRRAGLFSWLVIFTVVPVALTFLASHYFLPYSIWGTRHLIIVNVPYLMLVAVALNRLRIVWVKISVLVVLACWVSVLAFALIVRRDEIYVWCAWDLLARRMAVTERKRTEPIKVYVFEDLVAYHTWFALSSMKESKFKVEVIKDVPGIVEDPAYFLPRGFDDVTARDAKDPTANVFNEDYFWIAFRDHERKPEQLPLKILTARGYMVGESFEMNARGGKAFLVSIKRQ